MPPSRRWSAPGCIPGHRGLHPLLPPARVGGDRAGARGRHPTPRLTPASTSSTVVRERARGALDATVVIKLNGGLGTGMGMDRAKSLLPVRDDLDLPGHHRPPGQVRPRRHGGVRLPLMLMNSFRTRDDTLSALDRYDDLPVGDLPLDILQNREPKLASTTSPRWSGPRTRPSSGVRLGTATSTRRCTRRASSSSLLAAGLRYAFVSNADNLGATVDGRVAGWFAASGAPFANEVCRRTPADRKGGHLAIRRSDGQLDLARLRPDRPRGRGRLRRPDPPPVLQLQQPVDRPARARRDARAHDGVLGLPLIRNVKNVDPADRTSPKVVQIETAMGAAVEVFEGSQALEVERARFLPVKSTNDLLAMRSDAYELAEDGSLQLAGRRRAEAPYIDLDPELLQGAGGVRCPLPDGRPRPCAKPRPSGSRASGPSVPESPCAGRCGLPVDGSPGTIPDADRADLKRKRSRLGLERPTVSRESRVGAHAQRGRAPERDPRRGQPAAALRAAAARGAGTADLHRCHVGHRPAELRQLGDGRLRGAGSRTSELPAPDAPVRLPVVGESAAGQTKAYALSPGQAVKIMTGAPMPAGADVVVPIEWTDERPGQCPHRAGTRGCRASTCVRAATTSRAGELLVEEGDILGPRQVAILAATGQSRVRARPRPRVVVISTGSELREPGEPAGLRLDLRRQLLHAGRTGSRRRRDRLPGRHRQRRPAGAHRDAFGPARARRPGRDQRWGEQG